MLDDAIALVSSPRPLRTKVSGYATAVDSRLLLCADIPAGERASEKKTATEIKAMRRIFGMGIMVRKTKSTEPSLRDKLSATLLEALEADFRVHGAMTPLQPSSRQRTTARRSNRPGSASLRAMPMTALNQTPTPRPAEAVALFICARNGV
jgi:hypothetical protein